MALNTGMLMELKHEATQTRKMLERVPMEKAAWKPHEKSYPLLSLAAHVANIPTWIERIVAADEFNVANWQKLEPPKSSQELLARHDANTASAVQKLEGATDEMLMKPWVLRNGDQVIFTMPKAAIIRNMGMNHIYHHRGQLSVYLRLLGVPVPGMYGASADDK